MFLHAHTFLLIWRKSVTQKRVSACVSLKGRGRGRGQQLPERVKRSLNPTLLRNVEYDVWHKSKRGDERKNTLCVSVHFSDLLKNSQLL